MTVSGNIAGTTGNLTIGGAKNTILVGNVATAGSLTKVDAGTLTLNGINNFGGTTISQGTVVADDLSLGGNTVIVNAGGKLKVGYAQTSAPGLVAQFYNGLDDGQMNSGQTGFNNWCSSQQLLLATTTVAAPTAHARIWYPDAGKHFYDMGFTQDSNFTLQMTGKIQITHAGTYSFGLNSDDNSVIWVDGQQLCLRGGGGGMADNNNPSAFTEASGTIGLSAGLHDIEIGMNQGNGGYGLCVSYNGPDTVNDTGEADRQQPPVSHQWQCQWLGVCAQLGAL